MKPELSSSRQLLVDLLHESPPVIQVADAARVFDMDPIAAAKKLSRWTQQGWLRRVSQGAYVSATLDTLDREHVLDDVWVLVPALYGPAYIGGRSAAQHWDLTEQIFLDVVVFTARAIRHTTQQHHGTNFTLVHVPENKLFGTQTLWRANAKVMISDVHRTIIDMLDDPRIGSGIRQVADCLAEYMQRPDRDDATLVAYGERAGNGAVFKRLGFLTEFLPNTDDLRDACAKRLTKGYAKLDPALDCPRMISRWNLRIPEFWQER